MNGSRQVIGPFGKRANERRLAYDANLPPWSDTVKYQRDSCGAYASRDRPSPGSALFLVKP
jgi:hypothetical protein